MKRALIVVCIAPGLMLVCALLGLVLGFRWSVPTGELA